MLLLRMNFENVGWLQILERELLHNRLSTLEYYSYWNNNISGSCIEKARDELLYSLIK